MATYTLALTQSIPTHYQQGVEANGFIYAPTYDNTGTVRKINITTGLQVASIALGAQSTTAGAFSLSYDGTDIIVANQDGTSNLAGGSVQKISSADVVSTFIATPADINTRRTWCNVFCNGSYWNFGGTAVVGTIRQYNTSGVFVALATGTIPSAGLQAAVALGTNIYYTNSANTSLHKLDCTTGVSSLVGAGSTQPAAGLPITVNGGLLYTNTNTTGYTVNTSTGVITAVDTFTGLPVTNCFPIFASNGFLFFGVISTGIYKSTVPMTAGNALYSFGGV